MKTIKKGCKAPYTGVILTNKEYEEYKKLKETIKQLKKGWKEYVDEYYGGNYNKHLNTNKKI